MMAEGTRRVIDFVAGVLDGEPTLRRDRPNGTLMHGEVRIGDSLVMIADATAGYPGFPVWLHVSVPDADATNDRALAAGAVPVQPLSEHGDGDRRAGVKDLAGDVWWIAAPVAP